MEKIMELLELPPEQDLSIVLLTDKDIHGTRQRHSRYETKTFKVRDKEIMHKVDCTINIAQLRVRVRVHDSKVTYKQRIFYITLLFLKEQCESLMTNSLQFGFKEMSSTITCTSLLMETIEYYTSNNSINIILLIIITAIYYC